MVETDSKFDSGIIFDIKRFAVHDGPGIRQTIFFKGCPLKCIWCHNPESRCSRVEQVAKKYFLDRKHFTEKITIGRIVTVDEMMREIEKEIIFFDESSGGVTFSGGEPLKQPEFLNELIIQCKKKAIHTTLDTCGYAPVDIFINSIQKTDLILYDLKLIDDEQHKSYTGVSNQIIIENLKTALSFKKNVILRFIVIPEITDTAENIKLMKTFLATLNEINEIHLLPYHNLTKDKYRRFGKKNSLQHLAEPTPERLNQIKTMFQEIGLQVKIGG